ncbi:hypothetical protein BAUCODRAFT_121485 [Baudoinia panamericana UAMH 10762]|uniref:ubiquitinyl hydrolase 1 n=1 Tax=Baudoinia panamericana (strain UAMH 10762) TaxID=717646 RepID=M2LR88_BAUPA|nr:uncharacterized protein BAUCODRAFT_121485 [Baudoinia panamericana UAMH 10762]EMC96952.1 hypothetical protein BAUCODRAFT_121485 [Baudoinia panamericana UAMH 10762]
MSGVHRFLSRREKKQQPNTKTEKQPDHFYGVFTYEDDTKKKPDKEQEQKVQILLNRLRRNGINTMVESNAEYALRYANGEPESAFRLLVLLRDTYEGIVKPYDPNTRLLGAVNREGVTCYLDALLFAMFARLDSFEAMLYDSFEDFPRRKLAGIIRLWVNMLRTGRLITADVTATLQSALVGCGWQDAAKLKQQDPSEGFTFITDQLQLPLLTLKMDLYHTGKEDVQDDHKFVNERLLEVAILDEPPEGTSVITLEACLEHYFNSRIEVKRHLENRRRNTLKSMSSTETASKVEKEPATHVEVVEVIDTPVQSPMVETPSQSKDPNASKDPFERLRPTAGRKRADSIFSQRKVELSGIDPEALKAHAENTTHDGLGRKMSTRTEVLMPAWQFFKLLPWYTDHLPTSDAQVAAHFSKKRPVLGICLKRYSFSDSGQAQRRDTYVDIPLEIGVPDFVSDDHMHEEGPMVGNFRLMLQSVVCHRGVSVNSGHYITLCRGKAPNAAENAQHTNASSRRGSMDSEDAEDPWMRFDDLARERVSYVDIHKVLREETPYMLFYQVIPIGEDGRSIHDLPTYAEATSRTQSDVALPPEKPNPALPTAASESALEQSHSISPLSSHGMRITSEAADFAASSERTSLDAGTMLDASRGRSSMSEDRRMSIAFDESSLVGSTSGGSVRTDPTNGSVPTTPAEEKSGGFLSVASKIGSRRGSKVSKSSATSRSRPTSVGPDNNGSRFSLNMSKLTQRVSRGEAPVIQPSEAVAAELIGQVDATQEKAPIVSAIVLPENGSKESVITAKAVPRPKKEKAAARHEKRKSKGHGDDRDCVVM